VTGNGNTIGLSTFDADGHTRILVAGNIGVERHVPVTFTKRIYHPSEYYAASLLAYLGASAETAVRYADVSDSVFTCDSLYTYRMTSAPLREMIRVMNVHSSNMMAESFTRVLGLQELNDPDAGPRVLERFCREELGEETALVNGSGLGNGYNAVTPTLMMKLLRWAWANPMMGIDLFASLPVWGEDGTLAKPGVPATGRDSRQDGLAFQRERAQRAHAGLQRQHVPVHLGGEPLPCARALHPRRLPRPHDAGRLGRIVTNSINKT
jgi:D-alanyl-D-alanine carboxypeptidase